METEFSGYVSAESASSEDDDFSIGSSDESEEFGSDNEYQKFNRKRPSTEAGQPSVQTGPNNIVQKLLNRERTGCFSGKGYNKNLPQQAFNKVPNRLSFCLKDIVPPCFLEGHMFMGLSACGQFFLSYKVCSNDDVAATNYSFNINYKYTLYFWIYQPHKPLNRFYKCCLFDDHGVDDLRRVTMYQWKCGDPRILIIHGVAEDEGNDSYITYVKVPKLGCLDCKKLHELDEDGFFNASALCLKCNLTIHTKYCSVEPDREPNACINLTCPGRIIIIAGGLVHMLHVDLEQPEPSSQIVQPTAASYPLCFALPKASPLHEYSTIERYSNHATEEPSKCDNQNNIVARIIADFSDIETDSMHSSSSRNNEMQRVSTNNECSSSSSIVTRKSYDELLFTCYGSSPSASSNQLVGSPIPCSSNATSSNGNATSAKVSLVSHRGRRHHRIVTKSYRNGVITVDMQNSSLAPSTSTADKSNTYEFSEDNEKCEKIATLRKRRLADKKYEFSEENSENIIPFTKIRSASKFTTSAAIFNSPSTGRHSPRNVHRPSAAGFHCLTSPCASPSTSPHPSHASSSGCDSRHCTPPPIYHASPISLQQGFRSPPCNSPVSMATMRSPSRHISNQIYNQKSPPSPVGQTQSHILYKPLGTLSPLQLSMMKRSNLELSGSMSPNANVPFLSPRREEFRIEEVPLQDAWISKKPMCTKKFKRRYVEEDDATSVITSEEDDCISPGYHTSLPMEVHGSCYSDMQMISQASYQQLHCTSVVITQHSFDMDAYTYYVIITLCQKHQKNYDMLFDWAFELINVCPLSHVIVFLLIAQFSARDQLPATSAASNCLNCFKKLDCVFHRRYFECRILFTWNMESGECEVLDFGDITECKTARILNGAKTPGSSSLTKRAQKLAQEMSASLGKGQDYSNNLRILNSNIKRSKLSLTDHDNLIKFNLKRSRNRE